MVFVFFRWSGEPARVWLWCLNVGADASEARRERRVGLERDAPVTMETEGEEPIELSGSGETEDSHHGKNKGHKRNSFNPYTHTHTTCQWNWAMEHCWFSHTLIHNNKSLLLDSVCQIYRYTIVERNYVIVMDLLAEKNWSTFFFFFVADPYRAGKDHCEGIFFSLFKMKVCIQNTCSSYW